VGVFITSICIASALVSALVGWRFDGRFGGLALWWAFFIASVYIGWPFGERFGGHFGGLALWRVLWWAGASILACLCWWVSDGVYCRMLDGLV